MPVLSVNWETAHLYGDAWISHHRLRHKLFVTRQKWRVPVHNGLEYDQFDTPAANYLLWLDDAGQARAAVRLIPTTRPYMVRELWPDWPSEELPESEIIWEATRFGCDRDLAPGMRRRALAEIICACQEFGVDHNIKKFLGVMPVAIFRRVLASAGCPIELISTPRDIDGYSTAVAYIHVSKEIWRTVRTKAGIGGKLLTDQTRQAA